MCINVVASDYVSRRSVVWLEMLGSSIQSELKLGLPGSSAHSSWSSATERAVRRARYMTLETMAPVSDYPIIVLLAVWLLGLRAASLSSAYSLR